MNLKHELLAFVCLPLIVISSTAHAQTAESPAPCLQNVCFNPVKSLVTGDLPLRGIAKYEFWALDLYTAALYMPADAKSINVLNDIPKSLVLEYHRPIRADQIVKAANRKLERNLNDYESYRERINAISSVYHDVGRGDRYELQYVPSSGTSLYLNGEHQITIPGADFAEAYFGIWLSETPLNAKLRDQLTGANNET